MPSDHNPATPLPDTRGQGEVSTLLDYRTPGGGISILQQPEQQQRAQNRADGGFQR